MTNRATLFKIARGAVILLPAVILFVFTTFMPLVQAQGNQQPLANPVQGLQVSPVLVDLNASKGKTYNLKLTVTNVTAKVLNLQATVNDFKAKDESGNPDIIEHESLDSSYSFKQWVAPIPDFTLQPKESRTITVSVDVPFNAEAGGHYGVIRFTAKPADKEDANVTISASVGTLVLARIEGKIEENLAIKELFVTKNGDRGSVFETTPNFVVERLENTGNVHLKPQGTFTIKNMFGKSVVTGDINTNRANVLPHSIRRFEQPIGKKLSPGRYSVDINVTYGTKGGVVLASTSFWIIPFKLIIVILIVLIFVALIFKRAIRRYNERVIRKANEQRNRR